MPNPFKHDAYVTGNRMRVMQAYAEMVSAYVHLNHPDDDPAEILDFVKNTVVHTMQRPTAQVLVHPQYGNTLHKTVDLLTHLNGLGQNIITPSGSVYVTPDVTKSLIGITLADQGAKRKSFKKQMLNAAADGDTVREQIYNFLQSSAKIFCNSVPGAMGSPYNCLYDLAGYNAITSTSRHSVMSGYAHVEKLIEGNLYLTNVDDVINYCLLHVRKRPAHIAELVRKYNLFVPSVDDLLARFNESLRYYTRVERLHDRLHRFLSLLSDEDRTYIYYANCLKTLFGRNDALARTWLQEFFRTDVPVDRSVAPEAVYKIEGDLLAMITSLNADLVERKRLPDAITDCPNGVRQLIAIARHMESCLAGIADLLSTFLRVDVDTPKAIFHPNMIRRCVLVSDTDSVIFSTQSMVEWYAGAPVFTRPAYEINAFTVYVVSRTLEHVFARLSCGFGMVGDDIYKISMKNEYLYGLMLRTCIPKHYAGRILMQEGNVLAKPKEDIKGVSFRGSDLCATTNTRAREFTLWLLDTIVRDNTITAAEVLAKVVDHELAIYHSVRNGEKEYLGMASIKNAKDYDDPMGSDYFYHVVWEKVFAERFGPFVLPNKGLEIPLLGEGLVLKDPEWLKRLEAFDPGIARRLAAFREEYPKKKISRIILPPTLPEIPPILRPCIDVRKIIYSNGRPFYLVLQALGFGINHTKERFLVSDFHDTEGVQIPLG